MHCLDFENLINHELAYIYDNKTLIDGCVTQGDGNIC